jgi:hypothetical protein
MLESSGVFPFLIRYSNAYNDDHVAKTLYRDPDSEFEGVVDVE